MPVDPPLRTAPLLAIRPRTRVQFALRHVLHEADIIILGKISVFLQVGAFVLGHGGKKIFDKFIRNQGMSKVEFGDIRLWNVLDGEQWRWGTTIMRVVRWWSGKGTKAEIGITHLAIGHLLKALKHLLRRVLIFGDRHHESNELLERRTDAHELLVHLFLIVNQTQACYGGGELDLLQSV